jgi:ribosomal protein L24E
VDQAREGCPVRLSFRFAAGGDRLLLLMEKAGTADGQFARLAEVGYTRQGSGFGKNVAQRECVVTGGLGTIEVTHDGKTYYVCCTGCRDYFNENAEKVLAEWAAKKK